MKKIWKMKKNGKKNRKNNIYTFVKKKNHLKKVYLKWFKLKQKILKLYI